jgi:HEAT repeat protein
MEGDKSACHKKAVQQLLEIGGAAIPPLLAAGRSEPSLESIIFSIAGRIGPEAIPQLLELLRQPDEDLAWDAARVLSKYGREAAICVIPALAEEKTCWYVIRILGWIGKDADEAVPAIRRRLKDPSPLMRKQGAIALGYIRSGDAIAVLESCLADPDEDVCRAAMQALARIKSQDRHYLPALSLGSEP